MFNNLSSSTVINDAPEDELLIASGGKPQGESDKSKKNKSGEESDNTKTKNKEKSSKSSTGKTATPNVSELSDDDLNEALGEDDDEDELNEENKKSSKKSVKKQKEEDDEDDDEDDEDEEDKSKNKQKKNKKLSEEDEEDDDEDDEDDEDEDEEDDDTQSIKVSDFLKARVELLIKKGEWLDWEGREDVEEWNEEDFAEMELQQRAAQKETLKEELLKEFGPYGKKISEYSANGGNPDKLIDIFKEQQRIENLSIDTEDQQKNVVLKYAKEFQNMTATRAEKYVNTLIADKELADASKEAKDAMEKWAKEEEENIIEEQKAKKEAMENKVKNDLKIFQEKLSLALKTRDDIEPNERKEIINVLTKYDKKLPNGQIVNEMYFKLAEIRKNLPDYIEFVRYVLNPKKYNKENKLKGKSEANEKNFNLIRTANKAKKAKSAEIANSSKEKGKGKGFKLLY